MLFCPKVTIRELPALTVKDIVRILELDFLRDLKYKDDYIKFTNEVLYRGDAEKAPA